MSSDVQWCDGRWDFVQCSTNWLAGWLADWLEWWWYLVFLHLEFNETYSSRTFQRASWNTVESRVILSSSSLLTAHSNRQWKLLLASNSFDAKGWRWTKIKLTQMGIIFSGTVKKNSLSLSPSPFHFLYSLVYNCRPDYDTVFKICHILGHILLLTIKAYT